MEEISNIISDLHYKKYDKIRIAQELLRLEYTPDDINKTLNKSKVKQKNINFTLAILLITVGILANFYTRSTYINNYFRFDFFSQADFMLFNERILKPTISISFIILGINLIINRVNINKNLKRILFLFIGVFTLFISSYISILPAIFSSIAFFIIWVIELPQKTQNLEMEKIFSYLNKEWKGSSVYVFIVFGVILIYSAKIEFVYVPTGERISSISLGFLDYFLIYSKTALLYGGLLTSLLLSLNFSKFKISLFIITGLAILTVISSLLHTNFQNIIYGCLIILISTIVVVLKKQKND